MINCIRYISLTKNSEVITTVKEVGEVLGIKYCFADLITSSVSDLRILLSKKNYIDIILIDHKLSKSIYGVSNLIKDSIIVYANLDKNKLKKLLLHELSHQCGLGHCNTPGCIMSLNVCTDYCWKCKKQEICLKSNQLFCNKCLNILKKGFV